MPENHISNNDTVRNASVSEEPEVSQSAIETTQSEQEDAGGTRRIAKNALMLYIRMFITMIVGLYTSRVVLHTLGVEDYGTYGVVGGVVAMMGFLNAAMGGATSRFLIFELGRGDKKRLADTFSSALIVHDDWSVVHDPQACHSRRAHDRCSLGLSAEYRECHAGHHTDPL